MLLFFTQWQDDFDPGVGGVGLAPGFSARKRLFKAGQSGKHPHCCAANAAGKRLNYFQPYFQGTSAFWLALCSEVLSRANPSAVGKSQGSAPVANGAGHGLATTKLFSWTKVEGSGVGAEAEL